MCHILTFSPKYRNAICLQSLPIYTIGWRNLAPRAGTVSCLLGTLSVQTRAWACWVNPSLATVTYSHWEHRGVLWPASMAEHRTRSSKSSCHCLTVAPRIKPPVLLRGVLRSSDLTRTIGEQVQVAACEVLADGAVVDTDSVESWLGEHLKIRLRAEHTGRRGCWAHVQETAFAVVLGLHSIRRLFHTKTWNRTIGWQSY